MKLSSIRKYFSNKGFIEELLKPVVIAFAIAIMFRAFLFEPFKIPSGSMKPTLEPGDYIVVSKYAYGYGCYFFPFKLNLKNRILHGNRRPQRGDIVVFRKNDDKDDGRIYIKRVIGLPGDTVSLKNGALYINNVLVPKKEISNSTVLASGEELHEYEEVLPNGVSYDILGNNETKQLFPSTTPKYAVPENQYFLLGDNRDDSLDSRFLFETGFIEEKNLIGKAVVVVWDGGFSLTKLLHEIADKRENRFFKKL